MSTHTVNTTTTATTSTTTTATTRSTTTTPAPGPRPTPVTLRELAADIAAGARAVSAAPRPISGSVPWPCSGCGRAGATAMARADLDTLWLMPGPGGPVQRRYCRACVPPGPVAEVVCVRCGDGPLLSGELAGGDARGTRAVQGWLRMAGWRLSGPVCPDCVGELAR